MSLTDLNLTLREAQEYLALNGIDWTIGTIKIYVHFGKIPSFKDKNSRLIERSELAKIVDKKKRGW